MIFSENAAVIFLTLWSPNFMQKIRKILRAISEKNTPDGRTNGQRRSLRTPSDHRGPKIIIFMFFSMISRVCIIMIILNKGRPKICNLDKSGQNASFRVSKLSFNHQTHIFSGIFAESEQSHRSIEQSHRYLLRFFLNSVVRGHT